MATLALRWSTGLLGSASNSRPLTFITGVFTLICGLTLFAAHHHWTSPPAIAITLLAVLTIIRGVTLLFAPSFLTGLVHTFLNLGPGALIAGAVALIIGAWLTFVGWFAKRAVSVRVGATRRPAV